MEDEEDPRSKALHSRLSEFAVMGQRAKRLRRQCPSGGAEELIALRLRSNEIVSEMVGLAREVGAGDEGRWLLVMAIILASANAKDIRREQQLLALARNLLAP